MLVECSTALAGSGKGSTVFTIPWTGKLLIKGGKLSMGLNLESAISPAQALEFVTCLRKASNYAEMVGWIRVRADFPGAPVDDRERLMLCDMHVRREVCTLYPEIGQGSRTRIRLSMPNGTVTSENIDDVKVEIYLTNDEGEFLRCETFLLTGLPEPLGFAVQAEVFHWAAGFLINAREWDAETLDLVTALRKAPNYADEVLWCNLDGFKGALANNRDRLVLCEPVVQQEMQWEVKLLKLRFPEASLGTRIWLSMPKEEVTLQNIEDVTVETYLVDDSGEFLRCENWPLTKLSSITRKAVEAEIFHRATGTNSNARVVRNSETE
jgi:hypothetical protein